MKSSDYQISNYEFFKNDKKVLEHLLILSKKFNLKLNVLGRMTSEIDVNKEFSYFKNILGKKFNFIKNNLLKITMQYAINLSTWLL